MKINSYDEGWAAGYNGEPPNCPYPENSKEAEEWWDGYYQGSLDS